MSSLNQALRAALDHRQDLLDELHAQGTDCYRLFHGSQEGAGGLTIDRYGPQLLVQSFHQSLETDRPAGPASTDQPVPGPGVAAGVQRPLPGNSQIDREDTVYRAEPAALEDLVGHEWGLNYRVRGRHAGQDPLLFLDLRNTRGWVKDHSAGKSVLNLFAYTCGVGLSAAAGGAREVCNLDFAEGNLAVGRENGQLNPQLPTMEFVQSDYFPAIRQLAGLPITQRRGQKLPSYPRLEQRQYRLGAARPSGLGQERVRHRRPVARLPEPAQARTARHCRQRCADLLQQPGKGRAWMTGASRSCDARRKPVAQCATGKS